MEVVLLRHGIAVDHLDPACPPDAQRPLTERGVERTRKAVRGLATLGVEPDLILTSPLVRAEQTARIAAEVLDCANLRQAEALSGGHRVQEVFELLGALSEDTVVCVGHAPQLDLVLASAVGTGGAGLARLKKAGAACVAFDEVGPGRGHLRWLLEPKALRKLRAD